MPPRRGWVRCWLGIGDLTRRPQRSQRVCFNKNTSPQPHVSSHQIPVGRGRACRAVGRGAVDSLISFIPASYGGLTIGTTDSVPCLWWLVAGNPSGRKSHGAVAAGVRGYFGEFRIARYNAGRSMGSGLLLRAQRSVTGTRGDGGWVTTIIYRSRSATRMMHGDYLGGIVPQTGSAGMSQYGARYDAFGATYATSGSSWGSFGFAGQWGYQTDADSGLMLLGHRYYDSSTGRFLSRDPIKDGRNWYVYADNNPLNGVDPDGLTIIKIRKTGIAIRIDMRQTPFPNAHVIRPGKKPPTVIEANGDIRPTHGRDPNPPLTETEKRILKEWGGMWPEVRQTDAGSCCIPSYARCLDHSRIANWRGCW